MSKMLRLWSALALAALPGAATAQTLDRPYALAIGPVALGGEINAVLGPADNTAFFNYTDYEHNALRMTRVRLTGDWRIRAGLALVGEIRSENVADLDVAGLFVRWKPWASRGLTLQAGRVPPVIGAFPRRAYGRDTVVASPPLAYQYLTSLRPDALPLTPDDLIRMRARGWRPAYPLGAQTVTTGLPLVSASRWDTGIEAHWESRLWEIGAAITRGAPAVPVVRETNGRLQYSARGAARLPAGLVAGLSVAAGQWIDEEVLSQVPPALRDRSGQRVWGLDAEYGSGPWLLRAEWLRSRFDLPIAGALTPSVELDAWSSFVEIRYRLHPRWQIAGRADTLRFGQLAGAAAAPALPWDLPVTRVEAVIGVRLARQFDLRAGWQQNWRASSRAVRRGFPLVQMLYWF